MKRLNVQGIDHLELYVASMTDTVARLCDSFGFRVHGRGSPATGLAGCESVLLRQHGITILCTAALDESHPAARYVAQHGDGIGVIGLLVDDAEAAFAEAVEAGAAPVTLSAVAERRRARTVFASVAGFGDVAHRFVSRRTAGDQFAPGLIAEEPGPMPHNGALPYGALPHNGGLLHRIDHLAVVLPAGELTETVRRYQAELGFADIFEEHIVVGNQAMNSKVVQNRLGNVTLTLLEPDTSQQPGQLDEFLSAHDGAGVQHVAFLTNDIATAVRTISASGVRFLDTPGSYYDALPGRLGPMNAAVETLRDLNILADRDNWGLMLQIFTETEHPRRTFFYELIDRRGARTFGSRNIQALYEAVERQRLADRTLQG